jgi:hypothetical protein
MTPRADLAGKLRLLALLLLPSVALDACAHVHPTASTLASSPVALEGPPADVTRALSEDPPLPGATPGTRAWFGLGEPVADPHAHHHGGGHAH